ncbi:hypothetical protein DUI87_00535 [Hirundo rustica rustica]|uniref:Uncharacterized protein n=1 Tax=Hirundo rustica rustica TaxID=333673 RepID=A0A3M0LE20_HIRRU|nr:hypothetical protein DUI87_00535 [Hirundo rustica rustica]
MVPCVPAWKEESDLQGIRAYLDPLPAVDLLLKKERLEGNISVGPESSGREPVNKAAAEGALPGAESCGNSSQEPKELGLRWRPGQTEQQFQLYVSLEWWELAGGYPEP